MEIRANYILVGLFTLLMLFGGLGFTLWTAKRDKDVPMTRYDISFNESVRGLSVNSDVLFSGVRVGKVEQIKISEVTPGAVRVRILIAADTPVRENSQAQLIVVGLTGTSAITISGGTVNSPLMKVPDGAVGELHYEPSPLSSVVAQMPDVLASANLLLRRMERMFSERNAQSFTTMMDSMASVAQVIADRAETIDKILGNTEKAAHDFDLLVLNANKALMGDVKAASESMNKIAKRLDATLSVMEPGLKQFSNQGLADARMLMVEMRNLVHVLTRVSQKLESDPRRFMFGEPVKEYDNK